MHTHTHAHTQTHTHTHTHIHTHIHTQYTYMTIIIQYTLYIVLYKTITSKTLYYATETFDKVVLSSYPNKVDIV